MNLRMIALTVGGVLFFISLLGFIYSFIQKKSKTVWFVLLILSMFTPIGIMSVLGEKKEEVELGIKKPGVVFSDEAGVLSIEAGKYIVGDEIEPGQYDLTKDEPYVTLSVLSVEPTNSHLERIGIGDIDKVRVNLQNGDEFQPQGDVFATPVIPVLFEYEEVILYPGIWYVGESVAPGTYEVSSLSEPSGEIILYGEDNKFIGNAKANKGQSFEPMIIEVIEGDKLNVSNMNVKLLPSEK